jgi:Kef-type K+ transport system membrane component KefB
MHMFQLKMIILILACLFFMAVGINLLISAYRLNNPFTFVIVFFASNLMILISAALCLGFALRLKHSLTDKPSEKESQPK